MWSEHHALLHCSLHVSAALIGDEKTCFLRAYCKLCIAPAQGSIDIHRLSGCAGFAVAVFDLLAETASSEQQARFCKLFRDAWEPAQHHTEPSHWGRLNLFRKRGPAPFSSADSTSTLCLCLMAFGPGRVQQVVI